MGALKKLMDMSSDQGKIINDRLQGTHYMIDLDQFAEWVKAYSLDIDVDHQTVLGYFDFPSEILKKEIELMIKPENQ